MADPTPSWSWAKQASAYFSPQETADQVNEHIFIGGYVRAADPDYVHHHGITCIVKLFADTDAYPGGNTRIPGVKYLVLPTEDDENYDIRDDALKAVRFIQNAVAKNERVLVHCHAGISRSATVVLFYLILSKAYNLASALLRLRRARPVVRPNVGFLRHLAATDERLQQLRVGDERRYVAPPPILGGEACKVGGH